MSRPYLMDNQAGARYLASRATIRRSLKSIKVNRIKNTFGSEKLKKSDLKENWKYPWCNISSHSFRKLSCVSYGQKCWHIEAFKIFHWKAQWYGEILWESSIILEAPCCLSMTTEISHLIWKSSPDGFFLLCPWKWPNRWEYFIRHKKFKDALWRFHFWQL